jgi:hypothetical protein
MNDNAGSSSEVVRTGNSEVEFAVSGAQSTLQFVLAFYRQRWKAIPGTTSLGMIAGLGQVVYSDPLFEAQTKPFLPGRRGLHGITAPSTSDSSRKSSWSWPKGSCFSRGC